MAESPKDNVTVIAKDAKFVGEMNFLYDGVALLGIRAVTDCQVLAVDRQHVSESNHRHRILGDRGIAPQSSS